jgi:hypothetical protein
MLKLHKKIVDDYGYVRMRSSCLKSTGTTRKITNLQPTRNTGT